jgi:hypothetical protein
MRLRIARALAVVATLLTLVLSGAAAVRPF